MQTKLPCSVLRIHVKEGDSVEEGEVLFVLEAMKMEIQVQSPRAGTVVSITAAAGDEVPAGHELARIR